MGEEDEQRIHDLLNHVCDRLQMESRRQLRRLLIEAFLLMCSLDSNIILLMLSSVLPLELVQDIYQTKDIERLRSDGLLLTVILSTGEPMPVHYHDQIGRTFVDYLLDYIEDPPSREF